MMKFKINQKIFSNKLVIGLIGEIQNHPNAENLSVLRVNIGNNNNLQIVCGANNFTVNSLVPVALDDAFIKDKKGTLNEIKETEIRGVLSQGMLCTESELGIGIDSKNILILPSVLSTHLGESLINCYKSGIEKLVDKNNDLEKKQRSSQEKKVFKNKYEPKTEIEGVLFSSFGKVIDEILPNRMLSNLVEFEHPADESHGDYATNIAMKAFGSMASALDSHVYDINWSTVGSANPRNLAELIVVKVKDLQLPEIQRIEVAGPGFINIFINKEVLVQELNKISTEEDNYGKSSKYSGQKVLIEHTSANPNKAMHIGHVRNNLLGNSLINLMEAVGYEVTSDYIVNDRGASISKVMWGYLNFAKKENNNVLKSWNDIRENLEQTNFKELLKSWIATPNDWLTPDDFENLKSDEMMEKVYVLASNASKEFNWIKEQISQILVDWEAEVPENRKLWKQILDWVFSGQKKTMERMGSRTDHFWFESDFYKGGKEIVTKGLEKGIFRKDGDAVVTDFEKYGISDTIVIKSDGTALYITQDLKLTELKTQKFPSDKYIWVVGAEQKLTLQQAFLADDLLGIVDKNKLYHFAYGLFTTAGGEKIGSRKGNVVSADNLLDLVTESATEVIEEKGLDYSEKEKKNIAEKVGIGALKYFVLKANPLSMIKFDVESATSFDGNTAPYLLYTYARAKSMLQQAQHDVLREGGDWDLNIDEILNKSPLYLRDNSPLTKGNLVRDDIYNTDVEMAILRTLYKFPEVVINSAENYAPNYIADYIFDLSQKYNSFYRECPVLTAENEDIKKSRLLLTSATAQVIKNGLNLLGIETLERM